MFEFAIRDVEARTLLHSFCVEEFSVSVTIKIQFLLSQLIATALKIENLQFLVAFNKAQDFVQENNLEDQETLSQAISVVKAIYHIVSSVSQQIRTRLCLSDCST